MPQVGTASNQRRRPRALAQHGTVLAETNRTRKDGPCRRNRSYQTLGSSVGDPAAHSGHAGTDSATIRRANPSAVVSATAPLRAVSCLTSIALDGASAGHYMRLMDSPAPRSKFFRCPYCPTEYWVRYQETPTRDSGSAYCKVCRKKMIEWNDYTQPSFKPVLDSLDEDRLPPPRAGRQRY